MDDVVRRLPDPSQLLHLSQSLALLDAILCEHDEYRYYRFDPRWGEGEQLASMSNGSGDEYSIVFSEGVAFVRGFDHESDLSPYTLNPVAVHPGVLEGLPHRFRHVVAEPAFQAEGVVMASMACWWDPGGPWRYGSPPSNASDGSDWLLDQLLEGTPTAYCEFARDYYETDPNVAVVSAIFDHEPITLEQAQVLNPELTADRFLAETERIAYPRSAAR